MSGGPYRSPATRQPDEDLEEDLDDDDDVPSGPWRGFATEFADAILRSLERQRAEEREAKAFAELVTRVTRTPAAALVAWLLELDG